MSSIPSRFRAVDLSLPLITPAFIRGSAMSIKVEAEERVGRPSPLREQAGREGYILRDYRPLIVHHHNTGWDWSTHHTTYVTHQAAPTKKTKEEKEEESSHQALVLGSVIGVAAAAGIGYVYSSLSDQRDSLHKTQEIKEALTLGQTREIPSSVLEDYNQLIEAQLAIDELKTSKLTNYYFSVLGCFAGGIALASGGGLLIPLLMTVGKVSLLASSIGGALNWGLHFNDESRLARHYEVILGNPRREVQGLADRVLQGLTIRPSPVPFPGCATAPPYDL